MNTEIFILVNLVIMFGFNYPSGFIAEIWEGSMANHMQAKFSAIYHKHGSNAVMFVLYTELSQDHQNRLVQYIIDNYKG